MVVERPRRGRLLEVARWGLVPSWAGDPSKGSRLINARAEGAERGPAFRKALAQRRCILPADSFYEWRRRHDASGRLQRQPFRFLRADGDLLALAGLWEAWRDAEGRWLVTCTVLTTDASADMLPVHSRMPLPLEQSDWGRWLDPQSSVASVRDLLVPPAPGLLVHHAVSSEVNKAANDHPGLLEAVPEPAEPIGPEL
jgi:putative SOS response-associated peptidase YedK